MSTSVAVAVAVTVGLLGGLLTAGFARVSRNGFVAPVGYVVVSLCVAGVVLPAVGGSWVLRASLVLAALVSMTGVLLIHVLRHAAEDNRARMAEGDNTPSVARSTPVWGPLLVAVLLLLLSAVTALVR